MLVPNQLFVLLPLAMLLVSVATSQYVPVPPVNVTVSIKSEMGDATTLNVHCRTYWGGLPIPIIDLGLHKLCKRRALQLLLPGRHSTGARQSSVHVRL
ncbi:hypothetical protein KC19_10G097700 [Ceratodon purpureus]|uniref:Uncharacterized protein n=1 Tax=Ceratodon purpureus TaxID=3225 RepID=A0A8T0GMA7_CERPU|nr:hypothetical protein KC19_10G097700 [Ceratodon purpureus]